jgi:hypothetical protein
MNAVQKQIINTPGVALLYKITGVSLALYATILNTTAKMSMLLSADSAAGGENLDLNNPDGTITRFPKISTIISGVDESDLTPATSSTSATGLGTMDLTINVAPTEFTSMTAFIKDLYTNKDSHFLIVIPTGFSYKGQVVAGTKVADGWAFMIGKLTTGLAMEYAEGAKNLPLTFASQSNTELILADFTGITPPAIEWLGGGTTVTPAALVSGDETVLLAGKVCLKPTTYV